MDDKTLTRKEAVSAYQKKWWANRPMWLKKIAWKRMRLYSMKRTSKLTPEERNELRIYHNEWYANRSPEQKLSDHARYSDPKEKEARQERYKNRTPEQKAAKNATRKRFKENQTPEQKAAQTARNKETKMAKRATWTPEQWEKHRESARISWRKWKAKDDAKKQAKRNIKVYMFPKIAINWVNKYIKQFFGWIIDNIKSMRNSNGRHR